MNRFVFLITVKKVSAICSLAWLLAGAVQIAGGQPGSVESSSSASDLELLSSKETPIRKGERISFFGDSVTMQGGYIDAIEQQLEEGPVTKELRVEIFRHGLNGGRVPTVLAGKSPWGDLKGTMREHVEREKPTVMVIFLGVNDVEHGDKGTSAEDFRAGLKEMITMGHEVGAELVLCTPGLIGEAKPGTNRCDEGMDEFAGIVRNLAETEKLALCEIRKEMFDYLSANNPENKEKGILTYDGIHLSAQGNSLVAEVIAGGILEALSARK